MSVKKVSLKGIAHYPWLNTPDTKHKAEGLYHVKLRMDSTDPKVAEFIEWIDAEHDKAVAAFIDEQVNGTDDKPGKFKTEKALMAEVKRQRKLDNLDGDKPYSYVIDDEGEETTEVLFNFKMNAQYTNKKTGKVVKLKPQFFDAKGKVIKNPPSIYGGSVLKVSYTPMPWGTVKLGASIRFRLEAVQIIELKTGGGSDNASDYGFGEEEGFEASDEQEPPFEPDTPEGDDDDGGDGDF